jgi:hypothetical protein
MGWDSNLNETRQQRIQDLLGLLLAVPSLPYRPNRVRHTAMRAQRHDGEWCSDRSETMPTVAGSGPPLKAAILVRMAIADGPPSMRSGGSLNSGSTMKFDLSYGLNSDK